MNDTEYWRVKQAFDALLDLPEAQRSQHLDALTAADPELAQVLRRRLARLNAPTRATAHSEHITPPAATISGYRILAQAGAGGMGQVFKVQRASQPEQILALKQIHHDRLNPDLRRRFEQERSVLARLNHPNIVPLVDAGVDSDDRPYLVTTWVEGLRIDRYCEQQQLPVAERVRLVLDLAQAISHAHAQLIIHRDIKPANILVDQDGHLRVLDFGIAKMLDQNDARSHDTTAGFSLMTLRYAAPEQLQHGLIGPACDLYAIGVVLYELITGVSPYVGADSPAALSLAITQQQAFPPSRQPSCTLPIAHPDDLDAIVLKLLRKSASERYHSAQELAADLNRWLQGDIVLARSDERGYLLRRWLWRWRFAVAAAALLPILVGWHVWRLDAQLAETSRQRDRARAVADYFVSLFRSADPGDAREGDVSARALLDASAATLQSNAELRPDTRSLLQMVTGRVYTDLGMLTEAEPLLAESIDSMETESPLPVDELLDAYRTHAAVLYQLDRVADSLARSRKAIALLEAQGDRQSERYAGMLQNAALALATNGEQTEADALFAQALTVLERNHANSRAYVLLLLNLGGDQASRLDHHAALVYLDKAEAAGSAFQQQDPDLWLTIRRAALSSRLELASSASTRDKLAAEIAAELDAAQRFYGQDHLETAFWSEMAGMQAAIRDRSEAAAQHFRLASKIAETLLPEANHPFRQRFDFNTLVADFVRQPKDPVLQQRLMAESARLSVDHPESAEQALISDLLKSNTCQPSRDGVDPAITDTASSLIKTLPVWLQHIHRRCT